MRKIVVVANGQSLSGAADFDWGQIPGFVVLPSNIDSATSISFEVSADGENYVDLYNAAGTEVNPTAGVSRAIALDPAVFNGVRHLKVRLGSTGTPVVATADRSIEIFYE